jgi:hypothetical protein
MPEFIDPNIDFQQPQQAAQMAQLLAQRLRKKADATGLPEGQMAGGFLTDPSVFEYLSTMAQGYAANQAEADAQAKQQVFQDRVNKASGEWRSNFPQTLPATPERQGPVDPSNPTELNAVPEQPVTSSRILQHTMRGMAIPGMADEAKIYNQSAQADLTREDNQAERAATLKQTLLARAEEARIRAEERARDIQLRLEDRALDRASRERLAAQSVAAQREATQARLDIAKLTGSVGDAMKGTEIRMDVEALSRRMEPHAPMVNTAQQVQDMLDSYKDPVTGKYKDIPGVGLGQGILTPAIQKKEATTNRQKMQMFVNAMVRAQAGLSQTLSESEKALAEAMSTGTVRQEQLIDAWPGLMAKVNASSKNIAAGYDPRVVEIYNSRNPDALRPVGPRTKSKFVIEEDK